MTETPPHALLRPRVALPFLAISLIWGSTWFVITGQIADVPAGWSVTWRFALATPAMFVLALAMRNRLAMPGRAHLLALTIGLFQFSGNYNLVYLAELHLTSGIVAVMVGMMIVPNAVLGRIVLGQPITRRFLAGSTVALAGILVLLANEAQSAWIGGNVALGAWLGVGAMLAASISNVVQANNTGRSVPLFTLISWSMLYGTLIDGSLALLFYGLPVIPTDPQYWLGTAYLAVAGSVVTFPLYYGLIREIGAGRAAYHNVLVVIVAMLISTALEGYHWSMLAIAGAVLALSGLFLALRAKTVPPAT
ncbi:EamA family transporter [Altererythrobacter salegens]|uniref:EamA family transporter n=1 Tax=Croceibacterium salegens TaxID=1737568 RepID=A0A6I4SWZ8_9SPHN|nr:DMT family transporter [Croceibacterium salegens]MXO60604.1 EamA family transporter [Croceibacterium salegens]